MHLLRNLVFIEAYHGFQLVLRYIDTHVNQLEDDYPVIVSSPFFQSPPRPLLVQFRSHNTSSVSC